MGQLPETYNLLHPDIVTDIHRQYLQAGARVVFANTFGANAHKLAGSGVTPEQAITAGVRCAKQAAAAFDGAYVGLDIGPIGELLCPMGQLSFDEAYALFAEQVEAGVKAGADAVFIETMTDLYEAKAAVLAAKEHSSLPVFCTMSFEKDRRTFTGCPLSAMALTLSGLGVDGLGMNCSVGPVEMLDMAEEIQRYTDLPLIIKPNAGLPEIVDGETRYSITREEFTQAMKTLAQRGAAMVGGCCGTDPAYIRALSEAVRGVVPVSYTHLDVYKRQAVGRPHIKPNAPDVLYKLPVRRDLPAQRGRRRVTHRQNGLAAGVFRVNVAQRRLAGARQVARHLPQLLGQRVRVRRCAGRAQIPHIVLHVLGVHVVHPDGRARRCV